MTDSFANARLRVFLFGKPRIEYQGTPLNISRRKSLALFVYLVLNPQPHSREYLASLFWSEHDSSRARAGLRRALVDLNQTPLRAWIDNTSKSLGLATTDGLWIDVHRFTQLVETATSRTALEEAAKLYQGHFISGFSLPDSIAYDDWQSLQMQLLQQKMSAALMDLSRYYQHQRDYENAVAITRRLITHDPYNEQARAQLMRLLALSGQRAAALRSYETYVTLLARELQVAPEAGMTDLYRAIKRKLPLDAIESTAAVYCNIPLKPALLVGREDTLHELSRRLCSAPERRAPLILQGWPGIGKTTLATTLAYHFEIRGFFSDGILWTSLGETPIIADVLIAWGNALGLKGLESVQPINELVAQLTVALQHRRMLLIIDDVWEIEHGAVFNFGGTQSRILITTRTNKVAVGLAHQPTDIYKVPILNDENGLTLLSALTPDVTRLYPQESRDLINDLEGLPLAIQVAGRLLHAEAAMGWSIRDLISEIREGALLLEAQAPADRIDLVTQTIPTVAALLQRSTHRLSEETRRRFAFLGAFAPKPATFDLEAIEAVWQVEDARATLRDLVSRGLLEPLGDGLFQMHALLAVHAQSLLTA